VVFPQQRLWGRLVSENGKRIKGFNSLPEKYIMDGFAKRASALRPHSTFLMLFKVEQMVALDRLIFTSPDYVKREPTLYSGYVSSISQYHKPNKELTKFPRLIPTLKTDANPVEVDDLIFRGKHSIYRSSI
jgi:hypothetical protein